MHAESRPRVGEEELVEDIKQAVARGRSGMHRAIASQFAVHGQSLQGSLGGELVEQCRRLGQVINTKDQQRF